MMGDIRRGLEVMLNPSIPENSDEDNQGRGIRTRDRAVPTEAREEGKGRGSTKAVLLNSRVDP